MKKIPMFFVKWVLLLSSALILFCVDGFSQQNTHAAIQLETVRQSFELLGQSNAYVEDLTSASRNVLPLGIKRVINNMEVITERDENILGSQMKGITLRQRLAIREDWGGVVIESVTEFNVPL